jgi:hypothetical protein
VHTCIKHGTILKPTKAKIGRREVTHQGFIVGHGYYYKDPEAVRPLVDMRLPTTAAELKSQMSMLGRYREFVPDFAQLAAPLEAIMQERWKGDTFSSGLQERLVELRRQVAQETMLTMPDWNRPFHWGIDTQPTFGWAGVVGQVDDQNKFWPTRFHVEKGERGRQEKMADGDGGVRVVLLPMRKWARVFAVQPELHSRRPQVAAVAGGLD